jgi:hypothetical protein
LVQGKPRRGALPQGKPRRGALPQGKPRRGALPLDPIKGTALKTRGSKGCALGGVWGSAPCLSSRCRREVSEITGPVSVHPQREDGLWFVCCPEMGLFFVNVNQVLVRLWACRRSRLSDR